MRPLRSRQKRWHHKQGWGVLPSSLGLTGRQPALRSDTEARPMFNRVSRMQPILIAVALSPVQDFKELLHLFWEVEISGWSRFSISSQLISPIHHRSLSSLRKRQDGLRREVGESGPILARLSHERYELPIARQKRACPPSSCEPAWPGYFTLSRGPTTHCLWLVIARSAVTKQSIWLDRHALVPRARDDNQECEISGLAVARFHSGVVWRNRMRYA